MTLKTQNSICEAHFKILWNWIVHTNNHKGLPTHLGLWIKRQIDHKFGSWSLIYNKMWGLIEGNNSTQWTNLMATMMGR